MTTNSQGQVLRPTDQQQQAMALWRTDALDLMPYMACVMFSLRLVDAPGLGTFAVDPGHRLYVDFDAVQANPQLWTPRTCAEALLHECSHLFARHHERGADAAARAADEQDDFGVAADLEINDDLVEAGCTRLADFMIPAKLGLPDHLTAEEYYESIRSRRARSRPSNPLGRRPGRADQTGRAPGGAGQPDRVGPYRGCGSAAGAQPAPCEMSDDGGTAAGGDAFAPAATEAEQRRVEIATAAAIRDHAAHGRGTVPGGLLEHALQVLAPPKVAWRQVLASAIKRAVAAKLGDFDTDSTRRSRRRHNAAFHDGRRIIHPGTVTPVPKLTVVRDTSGSMGSEELAAVTAEIDGIARQAAVRGPDLRVLDVDAAAHRSVDYRGPQTLETVAGGGGTDMRVGINHALAERPRPTAVVVVTDGYTPWPAERSRVPLIICLVGADAPALVAGTPNWAITVVAAD